MDTLNRKKSDSDVTDRTDQTTPPKIVVPKTALGIPPNIDEEKFRLFFANEIFYDEVDIQIGEELSRAEFDQFVEYQTSDQLRFSYNNGAVFWVCGKESEIHLQTTLFFAELVGKYNARYDVRRIVNIGHSQQSNGAYVRQPDFGFRSMRRVAERNLTGNIIGEVLYSQPLSSGHECAEGYLSGHSDVLGVVLVDLEHSWPKSNGVYNPDEGKMVYYFYPESTEGALIAPTSVVSFGPSPITAADVEAIVRTTHCAESSITGYGVGATAACTALNMLDYSVRIPGDVLMRITREGDPLAAVVDSAHFDLVIDLYELQQQVLIGVMSMVN